MSTSITVKIGLVSLGSQYPVVLQSMTNTETSHVKETIAQAKRMIAVGTEMVRITVPTLKEVPAMHQIIQELRQEGIETPIIADVHYLPEVAEAVAPFVDKVRINPGNFVDTRAFKEMDLTEEQFQASIEKMALRAQPLITICKQHQTAIRVGVNQGSMCDRIVNRFGNSARGMVESALEWIDVCERFDFQNVVFSLKSSNVNTMFDATQQLYLKMKERGSVYPFHLGVTEAADGIEGRVKSAIGIGALLLNNIGSTIRVSLTEAPENEVIFAKKMVDSLSGFNPADYEITDRKLIIHSEETDLETWWAKASAVAGFFHLQKRFKDIQILNPNFTLAQCKELEDTILQGCRIKLSKTEIIACPSCGRTQYEIHKVLALVKEKFSHYPNLKIGVMGCVVNGPGEMADADIGVIGNANGKIAVYKGTERISPFLAINDAFIILEENIHKILQEKENN